MSEQFSKSKKWNPDTLYGFNDILKVSQRTSSFLLMKGTDLQLPKIIWNKRSKDFYSLTLSNMNYYYLIILWSKISNTQDQLLLLLSITVFVAWPLWLKKYLPWEFLPFRRFFQMSDLNLSGMTFQRKCLPFSRQNQYYNFARFEIS